MKLKLVATKEVKDKIKQAIKEQDIQYSDDASFVLYELHHEHEFLLVREKEDYFRIAVKDIIYIEAKGAQVLAHTQSLYRKQKRYQTY